jgi:hypothetical protein
VKEQMFKKFAPKMNNIEVKAGVMWRVCYHNPGQQRYSAEMIGWMTKEKAKDGGEDVVAIILVSNVKVKLTPEQFEDYRRRTWPMDHEEGRNPKNATLGVQSGSVKSIGGL